jgi:hypothetical protein
MILSGTLFIARIDSSFKNIIKKLDLDGILNTSSVEPNLLVANLWSKHCIYVSNYIYAPTFLVFFAGEITSSFITIFLVLDFSTLYCMWIVQK